MNAKGLLVPLAVIACTVLSGCRTFDSDKEVFGRYYLTTLKLSKSADILGIIQNEEIELLSQSENVIASWGQKKNDSILWFNMVTFDQDNLTATRKYWLSPLPFQGEKSGKVFSIYWNLKISVISSFSALHVPSLKRHM